MTEPLDNLYNLSPKALWAQLKKEHFSFWMLCAYFILEYVRPQSIIPSLDVLPWDKIVVALTTMALLADPHASWVRDRTNVLMTLFLGVIVASSAFAFFPSVSWAHWFDFFGWYAIYFLIINTITTPERFYIVLVIYLLASFKLSLFGARTWVTRGFGFRTWGIQGPPGYFENSGELSIQMLMFSPIAYELGLFLKPRVRQVKFWLLMLLPVTGAMTVLGASSRGAQVSLAFQAVLEAIKRKLSLKVLIGIAVVAWAAYALMPAQEKVRFMSAGDDNTSIQRLEYWRAGIQMIKDHPYLGVGYFNFPPYFAVNYPAELWHGNAQLPHNIFIQVGTDAGLIGLAVFLLLIYRNLQMASDIQRACEANARAPPFAASVAKGLGSAIWGFVIAGQFVTVTYYPFLWVNLALTVSLANIVAKSAHAPLPDAVPVRKRRAAPAAGKERPGKRRHSPSIPTP